MNRTLLCRRPVWIAKQGFYANCGSCPVCRLRRKREWTLRLQHHAITAKTALFVTLTYDAQHVPENHTLVVRDVQLFYKRLRRALGRLKIKYFTAGEYGPKTLRPHYHAIIFGLDLSHRELVYKSWGKCVRHCFKCYLINSSQTKAFGYVAGYCMKKIGKHYNQRFKDENPNKIPEFQTHSNGLGREFCETMLQFDENCCITVNGKQCVPPRYYRKILGLCAENYTPMIEEMQKNIDETIFHAYPDTYYFNHNIGEISKTSRYYTVLEEMRKYHSELVSSQLTDWRTKC